MCPSIFNSFSSRYAWSITSSSLTASKFVVIFYLSHKYNVLRVLVDKNSYLSLYFFRNNVIKITFP